MTIKRPVAIYARKSTEQRVAETEKSVARQVEGALAFAAEEDWHVADEHVFVDDGISGAEFERRPALQRLLRAAERHEFTNVIVSEQKSLGRESYETNYLVKQLALAGIEVWSYMDRGCLTPRNAMDKAMSTLRAFGDEVAREDTSKRNYEAAVSKHARGCVVGGRVFGYRNVDVFGGEVDEHGRPVRSHVDRERNDAEAETITRIFEMYAAGLGLKLIAKRLTAEGVAGPRPFVRKDGSGLAPFRGWAPSTVGAILAREDYRGVYAWHKSKKRNSWGQVEQRRRPETEWIRVEKEHWRIVSDDLWNAVAERRKEVEANAVRLSGGKLGGRPPKRAVTNLLAGIAQCGVCGGGLVVETYKSANGKPRRMHYVCNRRRQNGACTNTLRVAVSEMDEAVLTAIEAHALTPESVEATVRSMHRDDSTVVIRSHERELAEVQKRIDRLVVAIEQGANVASVTAKLNELEQQREKLSTEMAAALPIPVLPRTLVENRLAEWRQMLRASVTKGRAVLDRLLDDRIVFQPVGLGYEFTAPTRYDRLLLGVVVPRSVWALPAGEGTEGIGPDCVYYGGQDDYDYGRVLERAINRMKVASPPGFEPGFQP